MYSICCTSKLLKRANFLISSTTPAYTTVLGNWYANIIYLHRRQLLLFVSDVTRLAIITPAKDIRYLSIHLKNHLTLLLETLGMRSAWIDAELEEMSRVTYTTTRSRSVLGTMNDYHYQIKFILSETGIENPFEIALKLSDGLVGPTPFRNPAEETERLLRNKYGSRK